MWAFQKLKNPQHQKEKRPSLWTFCFSKCPFIEFLHLCQNIYILKKCPFVVDTWLWHIKRPPFTVLQNVAGKYPLYTPTYITMPLMLREAH